jgi:competence protein ComEC
MTLSIAALVLWGVLALFASSVFLSAWIPLLIGGVLFGISLVLPESRRALAISLGVVLILGGLSLLVQTESNKPAWLIEFAEAGNTADAVVEVLNKPKAIFEDFSGDPVYGVSVRLVEKDKSSSSGRGYFIYSEGSLSRGDSISFRGKFSEAGRNARDAFLLKPLSEIEVTSPASGQLAFFNQLRADYVSKLSGVTPDAKTLVAGLAIGEIAELSPLLEQQMRIVSLTHLVAVSGSNCAIVVGMVYLVAVRLRFGRAGRTVISLSALVLYIMLVGPDPSVLRAGVMTASVIVMIALGRRTWALNALSIAAIILLIADPWLGVEYGFGLSVLATAGILLLAPAIAEKLSTRMPMLLALGLSVTISSQLLCLPLLMQLQPGLPTYSVIANLLAGPMVAPVTVIGMLAVIATLVAPFLVGFLSWVASLGTFVIEVVAIFFAELPVAYFPWATGILATILSIFVILFVAAWLKSDRPALRQFGIYGLVIVSVATLSIPASSAVLPKSWPLPEWEMVACDVGQGDALVIRSLGRVAVIDVGKDEKLIDACLVDLGVKTIDLLVLTHFDFDHVGGLKGALKSRTISTAIISGFPDDRPASTISLEYLESASANVVIADPTISGTLGDYSWKILAPTKEASEAKDSNDASVVMLFRSSELDILLLGDLGASGQQRVLPAILKLRQQTSTPLVLKVSHHGSNDQSDQFHIQLRPKLSLISVGAENGYGHPGQSLLDLLALSGSAVLRTDTQGALALGISDGVLSFSASGR